MKIPLSPIRSNIGKYHSYLYGFGYDHSRDDYLLVSLSYVPTLGVHISSSHLEIFSLRDNAWKEIEDTRSLPYLSPYHHSPKEGCLFNGAIHWFFYRRYSLRMLIVAFDLMERKLLEIPLPDGFGCFLPHMGLWVFGEFLSLWTMRNGIIEIWVMKEYKVHSSWTKIPADFPIGVIPDDFPIGAIPYFSPIYSTKNGDIIGTIGGTRLVKYNGKGQILERCFYCDYQRGSQVVMYTESLLSLPGDHEEV
jgi:F-box interacting protein